ncbi:MAG: protein translocase subunit SecF [Acidobacteria bacterium]|nr:protein translocase subunit SecF [Acidobacteriota bacterium]
MIELFRNPNYNFLRWKWHFIIASWVLILVGAVSLWMKGGPRYGIDFRGGTLVYLKFAAAPELDHIRAGLNQEGLGSSTIQRYGRAQNNEVIIGSEQVGHEEEALDAGRQAILAALRTTFQVPADKLDLNNIGTDSLTDALLRFDPIGLAGQPSEAASRYRQIAEQITDFRDTERGGLLRSFAELRSVEGVPPAVVNTLEQRGSLSPFVVRNVEVVGPRVGRQLRQQALLATGLALAGMLVYIGVRFRQWVYGTAAVVATFHDVLITLGLLSLFNYEFNLNVVAGLLTLVGFSVNDTIVTFDRIRENVRLRRRERFMDLVNRSINQTLSRTVLTSGLTFLTVLGLFFLGGEVLHGFAFTLVVGIVVGTYSSIFIASPIVVGWLEPVRVGSPAGARAEQVLAGGRRPGSAGRKEP